MPIAPDLGGTVLDGRYELDGLLGEGAFGRVYRAQDLRLHREVAVKVIKSWWAQDPEVLVREARTLARCSDPGIVQVYDVGEGPEGVWLVSELVHGEDLAARLARGPLGVERARSIAIGLCDGLGAAHALSIVHRDVKPGNVLLGPAGRVKITDFGVARLAEATSGAHPESMVVGTPRYMAPEQGRGGRVTAAADVYGVGIVLYEMLAGVPPFCEGSSVELALAHLLDPPPPLPDGVPDDLRAVVHRALAKDPADRHPDARAMGAALRGDPEARTRSASLHAARPTAPDGATRLAPLRAARRTVDPASRRRTAAVLLLALALLAGLVAAAVLLHRHAAPPARRPAAAPRRVEVPLVIGEALSNASARLRADGLRVQSVPVPAPGIVPGTVTSEAPLAGRAADVGSTVRLQVSEVPRWRTVASFSGRESPAIAIRGERWRLSVSASAARHCTLWLFCDSTRASVTRAGASSPMTRFTIGDGTTRTLSSGPGSYRVAVDPASGATRWTIRVQDLY